MNKLQQLLKNPRCRFKTTSEMANDYGQNYMDLIMNMDTLDVCTIMSLYGGKKLHLQLVRNYPKWWIQTDNTRTFLRYGPTASLIHVDMLTTHAYPKWSSRAEILKPGMLVTVEYGVHLGRRIVPNILRNAPGTVTRVLSVVKPSSYFKNERYAELNDINKYGVATELRCPVTNQSVGKVETLTHHLFKEHKVVAFEIAWHLRKATDVERKFYYSQQHGADLVLTGK